MTWFKVDDKFHSHAKVARLGDDSDALALWVVAGSWCADQLTDGWVPAFVARRLDPNYVRRAAALVRVGLWEEGDRDGEKGWLFHGWNEDGRQPTAEQVQQERALKTERQRRWREKHRAGSGRFGVDASTPSDGDAGPVDDAPIEAVEGATTAKHDGEPASTAASTANGASGIDAAQGGKGRPDVDASTGRLGDGGVDTAPTRPDPTRPITTKEPPASSLRSDAPPAGGGANNGHVKREPRPRRQPRSATEAPDRLDITEGMYAWAANEHGLSRKVVDFETNQFLDHHRARGSTFKDWKSAWQTWMRRVNQYSPRSAQLSIEAESAALPRPEWCRLCDERTRMVLDEQEQPERCPRCHPVTQKANA